MRPTRPRSDPPRSGWSGWSTRTGIAAPICFGKQKLGFGDPAFNSNPTHARVNGVSIIPDHPDRAFPPRKFGLQCRSTRTTPDHPDRAFPPRKFGLQCRSTRTTPDHPGPPRTTRTGPSRRENLGYNAGPPGPPRTTRTTWTGFPPKQIGAAMLVHPDHPGPPGPPGPDFPQSKLEPQCWSTRTTPDHLDQIETSPPIEIAAAMGGSTGPFPQRKLRPQCRSTRTTPDHPDHSPKKIETAMPVHPDHPGPPGPDRGPQELHERDPDVVGARPVERWSIVHGDRGATETGRAHPTTPSRYH